MPIRAIGLTSDLSLPGVDFTAMRRRAAERRDLDRAATPRAVGFGLAGTQ